MNVQAKARTLQQLNAIALSGMGWMQWNFGLLNLQKRSYWLVLFATRLTYPNSIHIPTPPQSDTLTS
jgi:hypothetical protein